jgi:hypothetical protein
LAICVEFADFVELQHEDFRKSKRFDFRSHGVKGWQDAEEKRTQMAIVGNMHDSGIPIHRLSQHAGKKFVRNARGAVCRGTRRQRTDDDLSGSTERIGDAGGDCVGRRRNHRSEQIRGVL